MTWLCEGLREVLKLRAKGTPLPIPAKVKNATEEYFDEVDQVQLWVDECLAETGETPSKELYNSYLTYSKTNNRTPLWERSFYTWMSRHFKKRHTMKVNLYPVTIK